MRGVITTKASREWARAQGLSGKLPVYNFHVDTSKRPEYGQAVAIGLNSRNQQTAARLQSALTRIRANKLCTNGGIYA